MIKSNSSVIFKALTMGVLLTNGSMATDGKDKRDSDSSKTPYKSTSTEKCEGCAVLSEFRVTDVSNTTSGNDKGNHDTRDASFTSFSSDDGEVDINRLIEEREQAERSALREPRVMNLKEKSVVAVLNLMKNARLLSERQTDPVKVRLTLYNVTPLQLENIMFDENHGYIEEINWTLVGKSQELTEDGELIDEDETKKKTKDEDEDDLKKTKDEDEDDLKKIKDEDEDDLKKIKDEDEDDLKKTKDEDEKDLKKNKFRNLIPIAYPPEIDNVPRLRRAVARGRNAPQPDELVGDPAQEHMLLPPGRLIEEGNAPDYLDPTLVSWGSTPKNGNADSENLANPSLSSRAAHTGLVHIFCKQDASVAVTAQAAR